MKIELVSHCWRYSRLLCYQLSSLLLHAPESCAVVMTVFCTGEDEGTVRAMDFFESQSWPSSVSLKRWQLSREQLMRREIGRNLAALATEGDWIWFTDCDYCFGGGALDALPAAVAGRSENLVYPRQIMISRTHELGDSTIQQLESGPAILDVQAEDYVPHIYRRAIGGVQIVRGSVARERGYLKNSRIQRRTGREWQGFVGDVQFRRSLGTSGVPIALPNVYRIRHSTNGYQQRDVEL
jgi:hypothetical protein